MCYFATVAISSEALRKNGPPKCRGFRIEPHKNPSIAKALSSGYMPFTLTSGGCSCDLCTADEGQKFISLNTQAAELMSKIATEHGDIYVVIPWYSGDIAKETISLSRGDEIFADQISGYQFHADRLTKIKKPNKAVHRTATRVTLPAGRFAPGRKRATGSRR